MAKVQQHHVLEEQRREGKLGHKVSQPFSLSGGDDVCPPCDISTEYYAKALQESWEELVDGHGGRDGRGVCLILIPFV